jgi:hypothetical protein
MKGISTTYLLAAVVMLGSCARQYPVFNQMPTNAYIGQPDRVYITKKATEVAAVSTPEKVLAVVEAKEEISLAKVDADPRLSEMLKENSPKQLDEQLVGALATTQGQKLMAKPAIAAQIEKIRTMLVQMDLQKINPSDVKIGKSSNFVDKTIKKHMGPSAAKSLNRDLRIGLILIGIAILVGLIPGLGLVSAILGIVGVVFAILGLLAM